MSESMEDLKNELDESLKKLDESDVMSGKVENEAEAEENMVWARLKELKEKKETLNVKVGGMVNGGLIAYVDNIRGFIPASQLSLSFVDNLDEWLGKNLDVRIITADSGRKKLVLSAKVLLKEAKEKEKEDRLASLKPGTIMEGTVETLQPYGAFVNLGNDMTGLIHVSQISEKRINTPGEVLKEGETVKVKVLNVKDGKISLSIKALNEPSEDGSQPEEETYKLPKTKAVTTSLGDILKGIKLD